MRATSFKLIVLILLFLSGSFGISSAQESTGSHITVFTIGDSTMANKKAEVAPETGWCQLLPAFFDSTVEIRNRAINGRSTKNFIAEGRWKNILDSLKAGDYVFIQFGHNDAKESDSTRYTKPYGDYSQNLTKFVVETRARSATPILFTPIVRRKFSEDGKLINTLGDYPMAMRQIAQKLNVPLVDLNKLTEAWVTSMGDEPSKVMYLWIEPNDKFPAGKKDDTHLSIEGAKKVAAIAMEECLTQKLGFSKHIVLNQ